MPGATCIPLPPPDTQCEIQGEIDYDFGILENKKLQGARKSKVVNIECNRNVDVSIRLFDGKINMNGGVTSRLFIGGGDLKNGVAVSAKQGITPVTMDAELSVTGEAAAGIYSGEGVVTIEYQ